MLRRIRFSRKNYFLSLFIWIWVKNHFPLLGTFTNFSKSLFNKLQSLKDRRSLKKELSSANGFILLCKLSLRSLIYIRKNNGPNIESCGTAVWIVSQSYFWLLSKALWNLPLKKLLINWNKFPLTPFCFNLNNNPSCQTLSNALDMSRNTPRVSRVGLQPKLEKMSWVIASSW